MNELKIYLKHNKKARMLVIAVPLIIFALVCGGIFVSQSADISRLKKQKAEYTAQLDEQSKENDSLQAIIDSDNKDSYIEKKAREKGYVKSNEIVFYDISGSN